jgi:hypothetical protein
LREETSLILTRLRFAFFPKRFSKFAESLIISEPFTLLAIGGNIVHLVLLETASNQRYIFATNKLRENVGASELTYQVGTKLVCDAVKKLFTEREVSKDLTKEPAIDNPASKGVEVIIATSGKALLLVNDRTMAEKIIAHVTTAALKTMPGLTVHGAIADVAGDLSDIHDAVGAVHHKIEEVRSQIPSNEQRFLRLPWMASCATSGLPASKMYLHESLRTKPDELKPHSCLSIKKQERSNDGRDRLEKTIQSVKPNVKFMGNINELEKKFKETRWLAIIHADGNGLGEIFMHFADHLGLKRNSDEGKTFKSKEDARKYLDTYRKFSLALDVCTINAAGFAIENFQNSFLADYKKRTGKETKDIPFIPLILGGDDLTVICDGEYALKFTKDFLEQFEEEIRNQPVISEIAQKAFGRDKLGICAGIAIVKPHYPFHQAYELAEQLLKSAKKVKEKIQHQHNGKVVSTPTSALDFHILYDSKSSELDELRKKITINETDVLTAKPYIVSEQENPNKKPWEEKRRFNELEKRVTAMGAADTNDPGKRALPNSQLHALREAIFFGHVEAEAQMNSIKDRYDFAAVLSNGKLFFELDNKHYTHFMDALDAVEFWKGFDDSPTEEQKKGAAGK